MVLRLSDAVIKRKGEVWTREARLFLSTSRGKHRQHCDAPPPSLALRQGGPAVKPAAGEALALAGRAKKRERFARTAPRPLLPIRLGLGVLSLLCTTWLRAVG